MKKIYIYLAAAMLSASVLPACSDFLDEEAKGSMTEKNYYKTESDAINATDAIYSLLISDYDQYNLWDDNFGGLFYNDFWELPELMSDNMVSKQSSPEFQSVAKFQIDAYNSRVSCLWRDLYMTINACNTVITKVPNIPFTDETKKNQLIAEAKFFRGLCYFELTRFFGDVPLHTSPTTSVEGARIPRTPIAEIYPVILEDLDFAEKNLKYTDRLGGGRPYALSASALLAKVYVTLGQKEKNNDYLQKAVQKADAVIPAFPMGSFEDLFKLENRFKGERIWEVNFSSSLSQGWKGNQFLVRLLPKMNTDKGGPNNAQGYDAATDNLYNAYESGDIRRNVSLFKSFTYTDGSIENFDAPYVCKYWDRVAEPKGNESNATYPYLRTSEMYLIKAEALNEINRAPTQAAKDAINAVRHRAGLGDTPATSYADFKKAVLNEYRVEFAGEGHRWHDLVRMCTLEEMTQLVAAAKPGVAPRQANYLFPIPNRDRNVSNGVLSQNEGY
ncbi:RagB/SusD family nutrient uptake outer membrane protein [Dysgonomonas macrotermitis]|uniref:Starch-binding associating with outer membrane n=1 Tax=Dysgonomonas macrotermitis TaxID=1346286 RepID=A0A1M4W675_9BACT|nr:RagB/SusD family nutrient uptake outer membrane protein [Dysgonomonas macrotermitis]SHE76758.1 Starch-binding associating with outer membrane [Dysgonomonas macrotermitis]